MTATAVEDDQADAPALSPREEHLAEWLKAMAAADKLLRQAIADELAEDLPGLEEAQAKAAEAVGETYGALKDPERDLADLDAEIGHAETELATWQSQLEEGDVAARVEARRWVAEWEAELVVLRGKREFGLAQILPLRDAHAKARVALEQATGALEGRKVNATPALAHYGAGQKTVTYALRFGMALEGILRNRDYYEHDAAVEYMLHLCRVSGFRTENYSDVLPSDAEMARRFWDQVHADAMNTAASDPVPTAMDLKMQTTAEFEDMALQQSAARDRVDDRRGARVAPAPPVRDHMQVQHLRDLGVR